jgi:hypothetical protein
MHKPRLHIDGGTAGVLFRQEVREAASAGGGFGVPDDAGVSNVIITVRQARREFKGHTFGADFHLGAFDFPGPGHRRTGLLGVGYTSELEAEVLGTPIASLKTTIEFQRVGAARAGSGSQFMFNSLDALSPDIPLMCVFGTELLFTLADRLRRVNFAGDEAVAGGSPGYDGAKHHNGGEALSCSHPAAAPVCSHARSFLVRDGRADTAVRGVRRRARPRLALLQCHKPEP